MPSTSVAKPAMPVMYSVSRGVPQLIQTQVGNRDSIMLDNLDGDVSFVQQAEHVGDLLFVAFGVDVQFAERTVEGVADLAVQNVDGQA